MTLEKEFKLIIDFEKKNQKVFIEGKPFNKFRSKKITYKSKEHIQQLRERFINDRPEAKEKKSKEGENKKKIIPDNAVYEYVKTKFNLNDEDKNLVKHHHNIAMDAENRIGHYLEEYIYDNIKDQGWVWCTGSILRSIDFIKKDIKSKKQSWFMLQIKNSDNSENSSSNKIRKGTNIKAWFRRFSTKNEYNWDKLIEITKCENLSEDSFLEFLRNKAKI